MSDDSNVLDWNLYDVDDGGRLYAIVFTKCSECEKDFGREVERGTICEECKATIARDVADEELQQLIRRVVARKAGK